jgi:hypothetical protein
MNARILAVPSARPRAVKSLALSLLFPVLCGLAPPAAAKPQEPGLDVRADGLSFIVKEPRGWFVDSTIAREFGAKVIFYPVAGDPRSPRTPLIRVIVRNKDAGNADAMLDRELARYRSMDRTVKWVALAAGNSRHRTLTRRFCVHDGFCDYIAQVDPGRPSNAVVWVLLRQPDGIASAAVLSAYQRIVASIKEIAPSDRKKGRERADL